MDTDNENTSDHAGPTNRDMESATIRAKLDALLDHAGTAVATYRAVDEGNDFIITDFNPAAEEAEQVHKADIIGKSVLDVFPGVKEFGLFDVFQRVWRTGRPEHHPVSIYKDQRISGWRRNYVCKLPDGQIMAVYEDVTESKRSELATRMSEQCFRAIANYGYDWEVWVGPTGRVLWTNPAATDVTGYAIRELTTMADYPKPLIHEADRERMARVFQSALDGSKGSEQFRIKRRDGRVIWADMCWQPIYDEKGQSLGHRQSIRDITAHKLAEQAAERAEREKEAILDGIGEHVIHIDAGRSVLWANRAVCEAAGMSREQIIGRFCYDVRLDWHDTLDSCPAMEAMEKDRRIEVEMTSSGGRTWFIRAAPIHDRHCKVVGGIEVALDITRYRCAAQTV